MNFIAMAYFLALLAWVPITHAVMTDMRAYAETAKGRAFAPAAGIKMDFPYYHTTKELRTELLKLSQRCNGSLRVSTTTSDSVSMDVASFLRKSDVKPASRIFMVSGEHARELIAPETVLFFLKTLCGETRLSNVFPVESLLSTEFKIVLNANPRSRQQVEKGEYCLRNNPDNVDLNRNWPVPQSNTTSSALLQLSKKHHAFSEPETRLLRNLIMDFKPDVFLSLHSGTKGLYMPYSYDRHHIAPRNKDEMLKMLQQIDEAHCRCPYGAAGAEVGYNAPGTSIDWAYAVGNASYSFAFEIWTAKAEMPRLEERWRTKMQQGGAQLLQVGHHLGHPHFLDVFKNHRSDFIQLEIQEDIDECVHWKPMDCFQFFNPATKEDYEGALRNWAQAYLEVAQMAASARSF